MTYGPIRPPSRGSLDVLRLAEVGALYRERTRGTVCMFGVIAWLAAGMTI